MYVCLYAKLFALVVITTMVSWQMMQCTWVPDGRHQNIVFVIAYTQLTFEKLEHFLCHGSLITSSCTLTSFKSKDKIVAWYFLFDCDSKNTDQIEA